MKIINNKHKLYCVFRIPNVFFWRSNNLIARNQYNIGFLHENYQQQTYAVVYSSNNTTIQQLVWIAQMRCCFMEENLCFSINIRGEKGDCVEFLCEILAVHWGSLIFIYPIVVTISITHTKDSCSLVSIRLKLCVMISPTENIINNKHRKEISQCHLLGMTFVYWVLLL